MDEKDSPPVRAPGHGHLARKALAASILATALFLVASWNVPAHYSDTFSRDTRHHAKDKSLHWTRCPDHDRTLCAYMSVPLDYSNPNSNKTISLFLRKLPAARARHHGGHDGYLGTLLINPGGPGASGNEAVIDYGSDLSELLDGRYDIIGFDPRGVNMTLPALTCQSSPAHAAHLQESLQHLGIHFEARHGAAHNDEASTEAENAFLRKHDAFLAAASRSCLVNSDQEMLESLGTVATARDMKTILARIGELDGGLNFFGKSYGTVLGATFSAMFPEHVNRVVLDGVADAISYYDNFLDYGRSGMADTKKTEAGFYSSCASAGPSRCALARNDDSAEDIKRRIENLYLKTARFPIPVASSDAGTGILTASDLKLFFFVNLYAPKSWAGLAEGLAQAERGNGSFVYGRLYSYFTDAHKTHWDDNVFHQHVGSSFLSTVAIMCGDTMQPPMTANDYLEYVHELGELSPIGQNWAHWQGFCRFWTVKAREVYSGPWTVEDGRRETKFPVLFISQTGDPVTPLPAAWRMVEAFGNASAALLIQNGFGHCSHAHPSLCTAKWIREYFLEGNVPASGTVCEVEQGFLFPGPEADSPTTLELSAEDQRLVRIIKRLSDHRMY